jgi:autotransporter-associated beta strand protein
MSYKCGNSRASACLAFAIALLFLFGTSLVSRAQTATNTWDGGATGNAAARANWTSAGNWGGTAPIAGSVLIFAGTTKLTANTNLFPAGTGFFSISFASGAGAFTLTGNAISLTNGITNNSTNTQTLNLNGITLGGAQTFNASAGNLTFTALNNITNAGFLLTFAGASNSTVNSIISGTGGVTKTGAGTLLLTNANTFTGATTLSAGTLRATTSAASLGAGALSLGGGVLELANDTGLNYGRATTVTASAQINSDRLTAGAGVTHTLGTLSIGAQTLTIGSDATTTSGTAGITFGATTLSATGAVFDVNTNNALLTLASVGGAGNSFTVTGAGNTTVTGVIGTVAGGVTKTGTGTLTLSGANTYTGGTTISNGVVSISASDRLANTGALTLNGSGAVFNLSTFSDTVGAVTLTDGSITGTTGVLSGSSFSVANGSITAALGGTTATLSKAGTGTVSLGSATNSYGGVTTIGGGVLNVGALANAGANSSIGTNATIAISNGGKLHYTGSTVSINRGVNLSGGIGDISVSNSVAALSISGAISNTGSLVKSGAGTLILSGANTYSGGTTISAGTLGIGAGGTSGLLGAGNVTNNGSLVFNRSDSTSVDNIISGTGSVVKQGAATLTLSGENSFSGGLSILGGAVSVAQEGFLGAASNAITLDNGKLVTTATVDLGPDRSVTFGAGGGTIEVAGGTTATVDGLLSGSGSFTKIGAGTIALDAASSGFAGASLINQGTLLLNDENVLAASEVTVASGASLAVAFGNANIGNLGGAGNVTVSSNVIVGGLNASAVLSGITSGDGSLTKTGSGTLTLTANNTHAGGVFLNGNGAVRAQSAGAFGTGFVTQASGSSKIIIDTTGTITNQMDIYNVAVLQSVTMTGAKTLNNATYDITNNTTTTESGTLSGAGGITKLGTGTLLVTASNSFTGAVDVQAGVLDLNSSTGSAAGATASVSVSSGATLLISQSGQVNNGAPVTLSGGTIARGSGVSEVFGSLNITTASTLDFGSGATGNLTFGTYEDNATPSALLTVNNFLPGNSFTFSSTSFTAGDVGSYFSFGTGYVNSSIANTGSTFTITAIPEPSTYLAAAGLLALMLWPSRKRLLKDAQKIFGLRAPTRDRLAAQRLR